MNRDSFDVSIDLLISKYTSNSNMNPEKIFDKEEQIWKTDTCNNKQICF